MKYILIESDDADELTTKINEQLKKGFVPVGPLTTNPYAQPLMKFETDEERRQFVEINSYRKITI